MAHAVEEVEEMVGLAGAAGGALVINIGTLSSEWIEGMRMAMREARSLSVPVIFDPVGAGATRFRTETSKSLIAEITPTVIRGNGSEIMALVDGSVKTMGVDSSRASDSAEGCARALAESLGCVVSVSGAVDIITDGKTVLRVENGDTLMARVTGLGCTATSVIGAFASVNREFLSATYHAMAVLGICGEIAAGSSQGPGSLQMNLYDALYNLNAEEIEAHLK
jgi:hydroxyethylthiazole kinase